MEAPSVEETRLTHLHLSDNLISSSGLQKLLRSSTAQQLESLDCGGLIPLLPPPHRPGNDVDPDLQTHGILGASHLLRPIFVPNLRALRIHHSLVTHVPTLQSDSLPPRTALYLAETTIYPRIRKLFPQPYTADTNPRLERLTLTDIPRQSAGPLTAALLAFLRAVAVQGVAIGEMRSAMWRAGCHGVVVTGLRVLVLEFAAHLMDRAFTFFPGSLSERRRTGVGCSEEVVVPEGVEVWLGHQSSHYNDVVINQGLLHGLSPSTPSQHLAGAPEKSYIYQTAYTSAIIPLSPTAPNGPAPPMRDVAREMQAHRPEWNGRLIFSFPPAVPD
ncbi:leucine rich repeat domain containing protein [Ophiocordyceps camponoti-floridani]|uniref:Leucine rich repeat domain containing protein n=1 Tax=Ophiocordyceps camponoti-floridani TaxID=2030778 RepID=A0A8H4Q8N3_9HYPO|nr:leucine rich repeat domain containing protein [Ophiocordyceps camponoti-floridani]